MELLKKLLTSEEDCTIIMMAIMVLDIISCFSGFLKFIHFIIQFNRLRDFPSPFLVYPNSTYITNNSWIISFLLSRGKQERLLSN